FMVDGHDNAAAYLQRFHERINDDLDTPGALAVMWEMTRDKNVSAASKVQALRKFDTVFGLNIAKYLDLTHETPPEVERLVQEREAARATKDWAEADRLR